MKNLLLIFLIVINTFLSIFALVRTYKDKFSETSNNKTPFEIIYDMTDSLKYNENFIKTEHIENKLYTFIYDQPSNDYKYTRHLNWKQSIILSNNSTHAFGQTTILSNDNKYDYCVFDYTNISNKPVFESYAVNGNNNKFRLIIKSGIFKKYNYVTYITKENIRIYRFE